ncbi:hypothetical protein [Streptomyces sp. RerS4]|uniref:hypothetical protein n=1 Tax=Streptomyces sp. RerS4 TaxID=2942449 RepID=UPI00201C71E1|nr:hypothetical protein [Streptomyces sp. RerS4]UQX02572.1 hypothetical protein M4D82_20285 [Streptomyces sp. RerS4]
MPSRQLPPPPPPAHLREWLDETVVRADRARFLADLSRRSLGLGRLALLWALAAVFAFGWTFVGMAVMSFESGDAFGSLFGVLYAVIGLGVLIPAGFWFAWGARRERQVRHLLCAWVEAGRDPATDARLRAPARSLVWLTASLALGAVGLWLTFAAAAGARPGEDTYGEVAYLMGFGMILWITALLGLAKAGAHYRWAIRAFRTTPPPATTARRVLTETL